MPVFRYKGVTAGNTSVSSTIDADSLRSARLRLRAEGIYPTEISEGKTSNIVADILARFQLPQLWKIPDLELSMFSSQLATLLSAGVPLVQALGALTDQVENERLRAIVGELRELVNQGSTLADALNEHPRVFDELFVSMVRSGESSGALELVLRRLGEYVETRMELRNQVVTALIYPCLMLLVSMAVTGVLLIYVIPNITVMLNDLNQELPLLTRIVAGVSDFLRDYWFHMGTTVGISFLVFNRAIQTPTGRLAWDGFRLRLPVLGKVVRYIAISRFARTLSTLVAGGLNIVHALDISKDVSGNAVIGQAIAHVREQITKGASIAGTMRQSGEFPAMVTHMVAVGEASGELDSMLGKLADTYDKLVEVALNRMMALMGPVLLIFVAGIILAIILSTMLPLLSLTSAL